MRKRTFQFARLTIVCSLFAKHVDAQSSTLLRKSSHQNNTLRHDEVIILSEQQQQEARILKDHEVQLPFALDNLVEVYDTDYTEFDTPVFWHVSKSGGTTMVDIFSTCLKFVVASEVGVLEGHGEDPSLQVVDLNEGLRYVNVDTTTENGILRAAEMGLVPSGLADVIVTPLFVDTATHLFGGLDRRFRGRMFTMLRHPIERAVSMFYYLQKATWEETFDPDLKDLNIEEYAKSGKAEDNWMTRFLTNKLEGELDIHDVILAREVLRRKFLIGLLSHLEESITRFERFFGWNLLEHNLDMQKCVTSAWTNRHKHPPLKEGSETWNALLAINYYDMELYLYAKELFQEQAALFRRGNPPAE